MDISTIIRVNLPMVIPNALANLFFIFCLVCPFQGETLKQPLKLLLWTMICSTLSFLATLLVLFCSVNENILTSPSTYGMFVSSLSINMGTSVWLNFFYCMQIVPSKTAVFIWVKRNLKPIIYCIWVVEKLMNGLTVASMWIFNVSLDKFLSSFNFSNSTNVIFLPSHMGNLPLFCFTTEIYVIICLCIMSASSWSTATYLSRHMRQMASQGLSCSRFHSQVRVTVTGILQGALYMMVSTWISSQYLFFNPLTNPNRFMTLPNITIINIYMVGTSVNLGVGQAVFRQRAVDLWHRAVRCCSTRRQQQPQHRGS